MKEIKKTTVTEDKILNNEVTNSKAILVGPNKFSDYTLANGFIIGLNPTNSDVIIKKSDAFNNLCNTGKKLYNLLAPELINNYNESKNAKEDEEAIKFVKLLSTDEKHYTNNFIESFIPNGLLVNQAINKIVLEYCKANGLPAIDENNSDIDEVNNTEIYGCNLQHFVSLSILTYIIFNIQLNIREMLDLVKLNTDLSSIKSTFKDELYTINEYRDNLISLLWFLDYKVENDSDFEKLSLIDLCNTLSEKINIIQRDTAYFQNLSTINFSNVNLQFIYFESYTNVYAFCWDYLKQLMFPHTEYYTKICKKCKTIFEAETPATYYCSNCKNDREKINSQNSYNRLKNLHITLCSLFKDVNFDKINSDDLQNIKLYSSFNLTELKKYKNPNKMKDLQKYIEILKNAK